MTTQSNPDAGFKAEAQSFAICGVCDTNYPSGTLECPKCKSPLSLVRKCPECSRIVSAKHQKCIYCSLSFLQDESEEPIKRPAHVSVVPQGLDPAKRRRAILVSVAVFLVVMFVGLYGTLEKASKSGPEVAATTYVVRNTALRLQPNVNSGSSTTLQPSTVLSLMNVALDSEGTRWFEARNGDASGFISISDIAPPKVRLPEIGSQMLRAWLLAFKDPGMVTEAESAVAYFCAQFPKSPHCDELRWVAAERFRSLAQREGNQEILNRSRKLYASVRDNKGPSASEAARALDGLPEPGTERGRGTRSGNQRGEPGRPASYNSGREFALVDKAEVHVRVPNLKAFANGSVVKAPIAREIRINGKVAIPSNATCIMKIAELDPANSQLTVQLTAIEFGSKHYAVSTVPQRISSSGAVVVFPLESSLLIGK